MDPTLLLSLGGGLASSLSGLLDHSGDKKAELTRAQAGIEQSTTAENLRRAEGRQSQAISSEAALQGGTGFSASSGSFTNMLHSMAEQFQAQNAFTRQQSLQKIDLLNKTAAAEATNPVQKGLTAGAGILNTLSNFGKNMGIAGLIGG